MQPMHKEQTIENMTARLGTLSRCQIATLCSIPGGILPTIIPSGLKKCQVGCFGWLGLHLTRPTVPRAVGAMSVAIPGHNLYLSHPR